MQDSLPPASMTSASPYLIMRAASPTECAPLAHAVTAAWFGPCTVPKLNLGLNRKCVSQILRESAEIVYSFDHFPVRTVVVFEAL